MRHNTHDKTLYERMRGQSQPISTRSGPVPPECSKSPGLRFEQQVTPMRFAERPYGLSDHPAGR